MNRRIDEKLISIIKAYEILVKGIDTRAQNAADRAYGGIVRAGKGKLVESIGKELIKISWLNLGEDEDKLSFVNKTIKIPIKRDYLNRIEHPEVKKIYRGKH